MAGFEWILYKGKRILYMDIVPDSDDRANEFRDTIKRIEKEVEKEPPKSILGLCSVAGGTFNNEVTQMLKDFSKHNDLYMKMTAVVGVEGLKKKVFTGVITFTGRKNLVLKNSKQEALDWLVAQ